MSERNFKLNSPDSIAIISPAEVEIKLTPESISSQQRKVPEAFIGKFKITTSLSYLINFGK